MRSRGLILGADWGRQSASETPSPGPLATLGMPPIRDAEVTVLGYECRSMHNCIFKTVSKTGMHCRMLQTISWHCVLGIWTACCKGRC